MTTARGRLSLVAALATGLTATSLAAIYVDHGWVLPTYGAIVAVIIGAELGSRLGAHLLLGWFWRLVGSAAALLVFACARFAGPESWFGFGPTPTAVARLRTLTSQAFDDIHTLAAPVPSHTGLVLVTMMGVGLVAIAVDQLSVRAPLTGLPLLALYSVPQWLAPHGPGAVTFVLASVGYLALLVREGRERTSRWGRQVTSSIPDPLGEFPEPSAAGAISQVGRRIGFAVLGIALVVPPLLPGLDHPHLLGFGTGPGSGNGPVVTYNPITRIYGYLHEGAPSEQLRYRVTAGSVAGTYLQWTTLDKFDSSGWSQSDLTGAGRANADLPPPPIGGPGVTTSPFAVAIEIDDQLDLKWLPVPADTTRVAGISDQWVYDARTRTIFSPHSNTRSLGYSAEALDAHPSTDTLLASPPITFATASDSIRRYLDVPLNFSPAVHEKAIALTKAYNTPYQKALALQDFFTTTGGFTYDTNAGPGDGSDLLARFVLADRRGFCEQFASAMAIMARMVGIPARVAVGFTPGTSDGRPGEYVVTGADAHAWPELYFDGIGWLRFEPTPRSDGQATPPSYATAAPGAVKPTPQTTPTQQTPQGGITGQKGRKLPHNLDNSDPFATHLRTTQLAPAHHKALTARTLAVLGILAALVLLLGAVPVGRGLARRRRHAAARDPVARAHAAWNDVVTDAADLGMRLPASDSPRGVARRLTELGRLSPEPAAALARLAAAEERACYAARLTDVGAVELDARLVTAQLRAAVGRWTRLRAVWLPPSTVRAMSDGVGRAVGTVLDGVDRAVGALTDAVGSLARRPLRRPGA